MGRRSDMGLGEIGDVDVVADARAVGGRVVIAEDSRLLAVCKGPKDHGHQIVYAVITEIVACCAGDIKVSKRDPGEAIRDPLTPCHPFTDNFRFAVGRFRNEGRVLADRVRERGSVDRC